MREIMELFVLRRHTMFVLASVAVTCNRYQQAITTIYGTCLESGRLIWLKAQIIQA